MIDKVSVNECYLCGSCRNACPKDCISFTKEFNTFMYPQINGEECINCNLCEKACPALKTIEIDKSKPLMAFAARNKNESVRMQSSSGGIFSVLATYVIEKGGVVFGAAYDESFNVYHTYVESLEDLPRLYGSKYVQSDMGNCFKQAKDMLKKGKTVLFCGCPCQIGGLNAFLGKEYENLITMDFICHGILSEAVFSDYKDYLEKKHRSKIVWINFRDKSNGWDNSFFRAEFESGSIETQSMLENIYMRGFFINIAMKESCYGCNYKSFKSCSDFTVGDYWGAEIYHKDFIDGKGLSAFAVNTQKGVNLYNKIAPFLDLQESTVEKIAKTNQGLVRSYDKHPLRDEFFDYAKQHGNAAALKKYCSVKKSDKLKVAIKRGVKKIIGRQ